MSAALVALSVVCVVAVVSLAAVALRSRLSPGPSLSGRTLVVHTRDERSLRGVLAAQHADRLTLREAILLHGSGEQPIGGVVHVPIANVAWAQEIAPQDDR